MPGFVGFKVEQKSPESNTWLDQMASPLSHDKAFEIEKQAFPSCSIAVINRPFENRIFSNQDGCLAYAGEIVGLDYFGTQSEGSNGNGGSAATAEILASLYRESGPQRLCSLNGIYSVVIWDERQQRLTLINDRYGISKLYYWIHGGNFFFSTEYKAISQLPGFPKTLSEAALSDMLSMGFMLDDRTLFAGIKLLMPARMLVWEMGKVSQTQYWDYSFGFPDGKQLSEKEYVAGLGARLQTAVDRRVHPASGILLSGGLDSRTIAGMFAKNRAGIQARTSTIGLTDSRDVILARQIAKVIGFEHDFIEIPDTYLSQFSRTCVWITEANMNCYAGWIFAEGPYLEEHHLEYALTGIGAEGVAGRHWALELLETNLEKAAGKIYQKWNFDLAEKLLKPPIRKNLAGESFQTILRTLHSSPDANPLNKLDYLIFSQDARRHATSVDVLSDYVRVLDPFLDNDLVDFALFIPPELKARGYIYRKMIQQELPKRVVEIGDELRGWNIPPWLEMKSPKMWNLYHRLDSKVKKTFRKQRKHNGDLPGANIHPNDWMRTADKEFVLEVINRSDLLEDYFDMDAVYKLVQDHMEGRRNEYRLLGALITFSIWREQFCFNQGIETGLLLESERSPG